MKIDGSCHCGKIVFEADVDPNSAVICHCTDCQTLSGSAYRASIPAASGFRLLQGTPRIYIKTAESGNKRAHGFCADCGSAIYATAPVDPTFYTLRLGTIKQRAELRPTRQIWHRSALPWSADLSGIESIDRQPVSTRR
jgi:hypothetical protein